MTAECPFALHSRAVSCPHYVVMPLPLSVPSMDLDSCSPARPFGNGSVNATLRLATNACEQSWPQRIRSGSRSRYVRPCTAEIVAHRCVQLIASLEAMTNDADADMRSLAQADHAAATADLDTLASTLRNLLAPSTLSSDTNALIEVSPGIGGVEASAFADEIADMFISISAAQGWQCTVTRADELDEESAGTSINIKGENAYNLLRLEAGVHRVQRVPASEKQGRIHTSTAAVVVRPALPYSLRFISHDHRSCRSQRATIATKPHSTVRTTSSSPT